MKFQSSTTETNPAGGLPDACCEVYVVVNGKAIPRICLDFDDWTGSKVIDQPLFAMQASVMPDVTIKLVCYEENCTSFLGIGGDGKSCVYDTKPTIACTFDDDQFETQEFGFDFTEATKTLALAKYTVYVEVWIGDFAFSDLTFEG